MKIGLKNFSESFRVFINGSGKYLLFTALFYSLWLVRTALYNQDFDLHRFPGRMIGIATFEGYDVGARVSLFYKCTLLLLFSFLGFNLLGYFLFKKKPSFLSGTEIKLTNYSSLVGILFMLFDLCDFKSEETMELVYFMHKLMLGSILLKLFVFQKNQLSVFNYVLALLLSISIYFLVADFYSFAGQLKHPDFLIITFILCCLFIIAINLILQKGDRFIQQSRLDLLAYLFVPLAFLPFISILKDEIFLVCKTNGILLNGQLQIYLLLLLILVVPVFFRYKRRKNSLLPSQKKIVANTYFPILIFSLVSYILYTPFIKHSEEVFEAGNKYLAVMEFKLFGVIPTLEKFNSHLLSDYFFSAIYTFFNGLQGREMELYDFLYTPISFVLYYYLVYYITRNPFVAVFSILLFPLAGAMLPEAYSFGAFSIFALHKIISGNQSVKKYLLFFITMAWVILWRIDLGYSCVVAMGLLLLYYHFFSRNFKIEWSLLLKALVSVIGATVILFALLSLYRHVNLFAKLINALNYLTSAQTYGYSVVGPKEKLIYKIHYFIFPTLVALVLIALLIKNKELNKSRGQRLAYLSLLFTSAFYLVNFNRGLIRHSLVEGYDHFTTSLAYLIFAGAVFVFSQRGSQAYKYIVFCGIAFFTLTTYKLPDPKNTLAYFELLLDKIHTNQKTDLAKIEDRVIDRPSKEKNHDKNFIEFIAKNTNDQETFIDFCNSPMLYFYTKKITPSYFFQNPVCSHNDFLQNVFIEDLKDYNTPYLLFMRHDDMSRDMLDDVPGTLRHYKIAEYLFQHYTPYLYIDYLSVWRRNDVKDKNTMQVVYDFKASFPDSVVNFNLTNKPGKKYFAKLLVKSKMEMNLNTSNTNLYLHSPEFINDSFAYVPVEIHEKGNIHLHHPNIKSFQLIECDYMPDFSSEKYLSYNFIKLPYIWGTFDKNLDKEPVLIEQKVNRVLENDIPYFLKIPVTLDRISGNTLLITCKNNGKEKTDLIVTFGNSKEKDKSKIVFHVFPTGKEERYAIRISSVYKWYSDKIDFIAVESKTNDVSLSKIQLTKGM